MKRRLRITDVKAYEVAIPALGCLRHAGGVDYGGMVIRTVVEESLGLMRTHGFKTLKLKLGVFDADEDIRQVCTIMRGFGAARRRPLRQTICITSGIWRISSSTRQRTWCWRMCFTEMDC